MREERSVLEALEVPLSGRRNRLDRQMRARALKAATLVEVARAGLGSVTVAQIARRAGVSTASVYRDHADKDSLVASAARRLAALANAMAPVGPIPADASGALTWTALNLERHAALLLAPALAHLVRMWAVAEGDLLAHLQRLARQVRRRVEDRWAMALTAWQSAGLLERFDASDMTMVLLGAVERRSLLSRLSFGEADPHPLSFAQAARHAAAALFQAHGTPAALSALAASPGGAAWRDRAGEGQTNRPSADPAEEAGRLQTHFQPPNGRFEAYAAEVLQRDVGRLDAEGRRERVRLAALTQLRESGFERATMAMVARRAGVSTATLYKDYPDRFQLFAEALQLLQSWRGSQLKRATASPSARSRLGSMVHSNAMVLADSDFLWAHRAGMGLVHAEASPVLKAARATRTNSESQWLAALDALVKTGALRGGGDLATVNLLLGGPQRAALILQLLFGPEAVSHSEVARVSATTVDMILRQHGVAGKV